MRFCFVFVARATLFIGFLALHDAPLAQEPDSSVKRVRVFSSDTISVASSASVSPDGQWLAFPIVDAPSSSSLAILRTGSESPPRRVTATGRWVTSPEWSPSGDRIYFVSNPGITAGDPSDYGMFVDFDKTTGEASRARKIVTEPVYGPVRVSPDGRAVSYITGPDRRQLKVVSVSGVDARLVTRVPARTVDHVWSWDGREIYFLTNAVPQAQRVLYRVAVSGGGGSPVLVSSALPGQGQLLIGPGADVFVVQENGAGPRERLFNIYDRRGTLLRTITSNRNTRAAQVTATGRGLLVVESDVVASTRIMPVRGGAHRDLTQPLTYDWVMRWSPDGKAVYSWTEVDGFGALAAVPLTAGDSVRTFPESPEWGAQGANSRYLFLASPRVGSNPRSLVALDLRDTSRHVISDSLPGHTLIFPSGPGGASAAHDELFFLELNGDRLDVKGWRGPGAVRTLRSLPRTVLGRSSIAVHGSRVAWQQERGDSADLMIAEGTARPRRLLSCPLMPGANDITFSPNGRLIALHCSRGSGSRDLIAFVDPSGARPPRTGDTGLSYWYWPRWLPDNSGLLAIGGSAGYEAHVVRIPATGEPRAVNITQSDPASKWGFELSPDGRYVAYPAEIPRGTTVWQLELAGVPR